MSEATMLAEERGVIAFTVRNARPVVSKTLFALVDVEMDIAGIAVTICGVQARRIGDTGCSVHVPNYKAADGSWQPAVLLPEEARGPLAETVLRFLVEEGLAKLRYAL